MFFVLSLSPPHHHDLVPPDPPTSSRINYPCPPLTMASVLLYGVAMGAVSRPLTPMAVTPHTLNISPSTHYHHRITTTSSLPTRPPPPTFITRVPHSHGCPPCYMAWRWVQLAVRTRLWPSHHTPSTSRPPLTITTASPQTRPSRPAYLLPHSLAVSPTHTSVRLLDGVTMGVLLAVRSRLMPSHHTPSTSRPPLTITTASHRPRPYRPAHLILH